MREILLLGVGASLLVGCGVPARAAGELPVDELFWGSVDLEQRGGVVGYAAADGACTLSYPVESVEPLAACAGCTAAYALSLGARAPDTARCVGTVFSGLDGIEVRVGVGEGGLYMDTGAGWGAGREGGVRRSRAGLVRTFRLKEKARSATLEPTP